MGFFIYLLVLSLSHFIYGENPLVTLLALKPCETKGTPIDFQQTLAEVDGKSVVSFNLNLDQELNDDFSYTLNLLKAQPTGDYTFFMDSDGPLCTMIKTYDEKPWTRAREAMDPQIEDECVIPPGKYKLDKFYVPPGEIQFPDGLVGQFKANVKLLNDAEEEVYCLSLEFKSEEV